MRWWRVAVVIACVVGVIGFVIDAKRHVITSPLTQSDRSNSAPSLHPADLTAAGTSASIPAEPRPRPARFWHPAEVTNLAEIQRLADAGDARAQRQLAQAYERCFTVAAFGSDKYLANAHGMVNVLKTERERELLLEVAEDRAAECANLDGGQLVPLEAIRGLINLAAQGGDELAQVLSASWSTGEGRDGRISMAWEKALDTGDGRAIRALAGTEDSVAFTDRFAGVVDPEDAYSVMLIVSCRLSSDCGPGGPLMKDLCANAFYCSEDGFEETTWRRDELGDRALKVMSQVDAVLQAITPRR